MISEVKTHLQEQKYIPKEVKILQTKESYKMEVVDGIIFVRNKTEKG